MRASVPTSVVDNTYEVFPQGYYDGDIVEAEVRDPNGDGSWLTLKIRTENITPKEGTEDPGRSAFQSELTIKTDGIELFDVDNFNDRSIPFGLVRAAGALAGLAEGLGVATRENGAVDVDLRQVAEALAAGQFNGERVGFQVTHYSPKDSDKTYDQFGGFGPAS